MSTVRSSPLRPNNGAVPGGSQPGPGRSAATAPFLQALIEVADQGPATITAIAGDRKLFEQIYQLLGFVAVKHDGGASASSANGALACRPSFKQAGCMPCSNEA
jgi:hypothetical protein